MSVANSHVGRDFGHAANDFSVGIALMLDGGARLIRIESIRPISRIVVASLFARLAFSLVYARRHPHIGIRPF